jgi:hypothetical protein
MRFDLVLPLHDAGANINAAHPSVTTAIFLCAEVVAQSLVTAGADINAANAQWTTSAIRK